MEISMGVVHVIAECRDCSWKSSDYLTAQDSAARHARVKKHIVNIEVGKAGTYNGKEKEE